MTALTRRQTLVGAAATMVAAALLAVTEAEAEFIEIIVYDRIEDDIADAWALCYGGPRPPFRIERVDAARHMHEFKEHMRADYGIDLMTVVSRRRILAGAAAIAAVAALPVGRSHAFAAVEARGDQWACLGPIIHPVYAMIATPTGDWKRMQALPTWDLCAPIEDETDNPEV
jgi:hypothetical protein